MKPGNIAPLIKRAEAALAGLDWEILFVDDNSPDGTADVVRAVSHAATTACAWC